MMQSASRHLDAPLVKVLALRGLEGGFFERLESPLYEQQKTGESQYEHGERASKKEE